MLLREVRSKSSPFFVDGEAVEVAYSTRVDPLSGAVSKISEARAKRRIGIPVDLSAEPVGECDFCQYLEKTPANRVVHDCGAVSVPNKFPWEKYDWITIYPPFGEHKLWLSDLSVEDFERMLDSSFGLASICVSDAEVMSFMDFTNWGAFAGASQQHFHSQRKSVTGMQAPRLRQEIECCRELEAKYGSNPFDLLAEEERRTGARVIYDDDVFISAAFAPSCPDEIIIFPTEPLSNILQMAPGDRKLIASAVRGVFSGLFFCRGVTDLNIAVHMAPFREMEEARKYYRWHVHVYPRRSRLPVDKAGSELGFSTDVIDTLPETTAAVLGRWYNEGPNSELLVKQQDGTPNHKLIQEFRHFQAKSSSDLGIASFARS